MYKNGANLLGALASLCSFLIKKLIEILFWFKVILFLLMLGGLIAFYNNKRICHIQSGLI